jgi:hypothetical protein
MKEPETTPASGGRNTRPGSSCRTPAPLGSTVQTTIERGNAYLSPKLFGVDITVKKVTRGDDALKLLAEQGRGQSPAAGNDYLLAWLEFSYYRKTRGAGDEPYTLHEGQFVASSEDGLTEYPSAPDSEAFQPNLVGHTFQPGEAYEGWLLFEVPKTTRRPLLCYKRQHTEGMYGIWGYVWFRLS